MKGYVGYILNTGVYAVLALVFIVATWVALIEGIVLLGAIGGTGLVTLALTYLTSKQKWVEH